MRRPPAFEGEDSVPRAQAGARYSNSARRILKRQTSTEVSPTHPNGGHRDPMKGWVCCRSDLSLPPPRRSSTGGESMYLTRTLMAAALTCVASAATAEEFD